MRLGDILLGFAALMPIDSRSFASLADLEEGMRASDFSGCFFEELPTLSTFCGGATSIRLGEEPIGKIRSSPPPGCKYICKILRTDSGFAPQLCGQKAPGKTLQKVEKARTPKFNATKPNRPYILKKQLLLPLNLTLLRLA